MKVVLDTNVLITAFKDEYSYQKRIIDEIIKGKISAFANHQTIRENRLILSRIIYDDSYKRELEDFFSQLTVVENPHTIHVVEDPEDNKILESAVESGSEYLISEDHHLLQLKSFRNVKIVEPIEFWKMYEEETGDDPWKKWISYVTKN